MEFKNGSTRYFASRPFVIRLQPFLDTTKVPVADPLYVCFSMCSLRVHLLHLSGVLWSFERKLLRRAQKPQKLQPVLRPFLTFLLCLLFTSVAEFEDLLTCRHEYMSYDFYIEQASDLDSWIFKVLEAFVLMGRIYHKL
jgi:hypothetical protein